jgi:hypothetical protein
MALHNTAVSTTFEEGRPVDRRSVALDADGAMAERAYGGACLAMPQEPLPETRAR